MFVTAGNSQVCNSQAFNSMLHHQYPGMVGVVVSAQVVKNAVTIIAVIVVIADIILTNVIVPTSYLPQSQKLIYGMYEKICRTGIGKTNCVKCIFAKTITCCLVFFTLIFSYDGKQFIKQDKILLPSVGLGQWR